MSFFLKFDINFFSAMLLVVLYITMKLRRDATGTSNRLFFRLLWMTVFLLLLEVFSWMFDRVPGQNGLNYFFNLIFAWTTSLVTCFLAAYLDYHIFGSYERLKKRWFYLQPFMLTGILLIINFFHPFIFSISPDNVYSREPLMLLLPIINCATFFYLCYLAYKRRDKIQLEVIWVMLLYVLIPAVVAFLQVAVFGVFILWPTMAMVEVLTYIFLETISTSKDYLTGLISRHRFDDYLEYMLEQKKAFILVMMDLNGFKTINDTYGHLRGDYALKLFSNSLLKHFQNEKVIARYAGDEFVMILERKSVEGIRNQLMNVEEDMKELYESKEVEFVISFSYGYVEKESNDLLTYEEIIHLADQRMYLNKKAHCNDRYSMSSVL